MFKFAPLMSGPWASKLALVLECFNGTCNLVWLVVYNNKNAKPFDFQSLEASHTLYSLCFSYLKSFFSLLYKEKNLKLFWKKNFDPPSPPLLPLILQELMFIYSEFTYIFPFLVFSEFIRYFSPLVVGRNGCL